jgi:hypothetical protein
MSQELYEVITANIKDTDAYRRKMIQWYNMRHFGIRRKGRTADYQADLHFALIDTFITKWIPYFIQYFYARDVIGYFEKEGGNADGDTTQLAQSFDYKVKQKTNLERMMYKNLSYMLMTGKGIMKTYWDPVSKQVGVYAVNPVYMIVPKSAETLRSADRKTQVLHFTEKQYKAIKGFNHDPALIKRIKGKGDAALSNFKDEKDVREGINCGTRSDEIVIWENYETTSDGIKVEWLSPLQPKEAISPYQYLPYDHGQDPYTEYHFEEKEGGYYSNRGIAEMLAVYEVQLCKCLNEMSDFGTTSNRPFWRAKSKLNTATFKLLPNSVIDADIEPVAMPQPGLGWNDQIMLFQQLAQDRVGLPNMNLDRSTDGKVDNPTATQVNALMGMSQQMVDMRGRLFQLSLGQNLNQIYSLYLQFDKQGLANYQWQGQPQTIDLSLLNGVYQVRPSASADNVNKAFVMQKAVARKQLFAQSPWVDPVELDKTVMEADDPSLVKRLIRDPQDKQRNEAEEQSKETVIMLQGRSLSINPDDDHVIHLMDLVQFIEAILQRPNPEERVIPAYAAMPLLQHGQMHFQAINQSKNSRKMLEQVDHKALGFVTGYLQNLIQQQQPQLAMQQPQPAQPPQVQPPQPMAA